MRAAESVAFAAVPHASQKGQGDTGLQIAELRLLVTRTAHPCGCKSGAAMVLIAMVGWPVWRVSSGAPDGVLGIAGAVLAWMGVVIAAGTFGKLSGIAAGRCRHRHLRRRLDRALEAAAEGV